MLTIIDRLFNLLAGETDHYLVLRVIYHFGWTQRKELSFDWAFIYVQSARSSGRSLMRPPWCKRRSDLTYVNLGGGNGACCAEPPWQGAPAIPTAYARWRRHMPYPRLFINSALILALRDRRLPAIGPRESSTRWRRCNSRDPNPSVTGSAAYKPKNPRLPCNTKTF